MADATVTVLLFAAVREALRTKEIALPVGPDGALTAGAVVDRLCAMHPALAAYAPSLRVAVNGDYVALDARVVAGDEVAIIPPVAGG